MDSSNVKQTNPKETLLFEKIVDNISKLIERPLPPPPPPPPPMLSPETTTVTANANFDSKENSKTENKMANKLDKADDSERGKDDPQPQLFEKIQNNLKQIKDSFIELQNFEESKLAKQLDTCLKDYNHLLDHREKKLTPGTKAPSFSFHDINKELMKLKYQIPSVRKLSWTNSGAQSQTSSGSNAGSSVQGLLKPHKSTSFGGSSFYKEIKEVFNQFDNKQRFFLSCFAVLTEHAMVKRRLLTYWGLGEGILEESDSTPEEVVDNILRQFKEMGLIEPAINKRKQEVRSYKMDPLVRSAVIKNFEDAGMFQLDSNGNIMENCALKEGNGKAFLIKGDEKSSNDKSNIDPANLVTLFNVNELSPDGKLTHLAKKNSKDASMVELLSKMKLLNVLYLGRWQKSASYHIKVKDTEILKGLKSMEELKFLSLQGISRIDKLPRYIGILKKLVVLDLKDCYNLEQLPEDISSLTKLRYLDISNCYLLGNMPKKLYSLSELQVLKGFIIGDSQRRNLGTLKDLKGLDKLKKLTIIATRNDFPTRTDLEDLLKLKVLQKLTIAWGVQPEIAQKPEKAGEPSKLGSLQHGKSTESSVDDLTKKLPENLEKLDLQCFPYSTLTWLTPDNLPNLKKLYIRGGNFTTLKKGKWKVEALRLKYLREMKTNWRELKELFPGLDYLERVKCPGITLCPCDENGVWQNPKT